MSSSQYNVESNWCVPLLDLMLTASWQSSTLCTLISHLGTGDPSDSSPLGMAEAQNGKNLKQHLGSQPLITQLDCDIREKNGLLLYWVLRHQGYLLHMSGDGYMTKALIARFSSSPKWDNNRNYLIRLLGGLNEVI